jgi:hypothetical protein
VQGRFYLRNCDVTGGKEIEQEKKMRIFDLEVWVIIRDPALGWLQSNESRFDAGVYWSQLSQEGNQWRSFIYMVMILGVP